MARDGTAASGGIPRRKGELTPAWFTAVLAASFPGASVWSVRLDRLDGLSSEVFRAHLDGGGGIPTSVIAKLSPAGAPRTPGSPISAHEREVSF